jgi:hypothetical protein
VDHNNSSQTFVVDNGIINDVGHKLESYNSNNALARKVDASHVSLQI